MLVVFTVGIDNIIAAQKRHLESVKINLEAILIKFSELHLNSALSTVASQQDWPAGALLCGGCVFSLCSRGCSMGTPAFSHSLKKCMIG